MSTPPFKVKAVYEYKSPEEDDLQFQNGQIITVTENDEEDWYTGEYVDESGVKQEGIFPRNFVEKYEPPAPPRPNRPARTKKEDLSTSFEVVEPAVPALPAAKPASELQPEEPASRDSPQSPPQFQSPPVVASAVPVDSSVPIQSQIRVPSASKAAPPPVSEKPSGGSFKDRIAAFNRGSAGPAPVPFKPSGLGGSGGGFIKKPFVAPPPSKNAYVPVPKQEAAPPKIYRREEDPEIAAQEAETQEAAEKAGLAPIGVQGEDDQPKPTSLKDRIALLQKQQMEQAQRHADAAAKKEKPKKPVKRAPEPSSQDAEEDAALERLDSHDTIGRGSIDSTHNETQTRAPMPRRKSSKGPPPLPGAVRESDGNDADMSGAGDETEEPEEFSAGRDDSDENQRTRAPPPLARAPTAPLREPDVGEEEGPASEEEPVTQLEGEDEEEEDEEEIDPEVRRKEELRARMAKMSGGMGMHGMFGPPGGMGMPMPGASAPTKKKALSASNPRQSVDTEEPASISRAPPVPMPGLSRVKSPEDANRQPEVENEEDSQTSSISHSRGPMDVVDVEDIKPAPPVPGVRPAPPPVPTESRPAPQVPMSPGAGSEADDDMSLHTPRLSDHVPPATLPDRSLHPRPSAPGVPAIPSRPADGPMSPKSPTNKRASYFGANPDSVPTSPTTPGASKRQSRIPPIPGAAVIAPVLPPTQSRAPPPPPPNAPTLSRSSTGDARVLEPTHLEQDESDEEVTEYEGDYDTDIASTAPHKDALKAHARDSSLEEFSGSAKSPPLSPTVLPPRPPPETAPRAVPPPPPSHQTRQSVDIPRAAPPPVPQHQTHDDDDDDYDPYKYAAPAVISPPVPGISRKPTMEEDLYGTSPPRAHPPPPQERSAPPPPPRDFVHPPQAQSGKSRPSSDAPRMSSSVRRSTDLNRMPLDSGFVAGDLDLAENTSWWTVQNGVPPALQNRKDILHETEESTATKRGGKTTVTKDIYVLFQDYSQTVITVSFDAQNPTDAKLDQRHEQPPSQLRQDQLESAWERFGHKLGEAAASKKDSVIGDGSPAGLVTELLKPFTEALLPVGTRSYGALVYANLANASISQHDEIRPGDIITLRNARLQGKHGPMHAKYSFEVGAGVGHVAIVAEWDGTKKKVRAWEQGREKPKVKLESYKLDDLRSGEVKIWRIMPRSWVGWEGSN